MPSERKTATLVDNNNEEFVKIPESPELMIKDESLYLDDDSVDESSGGYKSPDEDRTNYSMSPLPLEVITTIEPYNYPFHPLKHMSNGNLTHRNIFTEQEREILRTVVEKYRSIVDTRKRTRETYIEKQTVWQQIVEEFNGSENVMVRTEKELKKCWDNMKYRARLAEKEQLRVVNLNTVFNNSSDSKQVTTLVGNEQLRVVNLTTAFNNSSDSKQITTNAVHVALEKLLTMQSEKNNETDSNHSANVKSEWYQNGNHEIYSDGGSETKEDDDDDAEDDMLEDEQPLYKKVRQESPKLSSILLGEVKMSTSRYRPIVPQYTNVDHSTKVNGRDQPKNKKKSCPITILPKSLTSCVSITNIPNPNHVQCHRNFDSENIDFHSSDGPINLGSGVTISPQLSNSLPKHMNDSLFHHLSSSSSKQMPNLKKMLPSKSKISKSFSTSNHITNGYGDADDVCEKSDERLLQQCLEFKSKEHNMRMKVLEKQFQAHFSEAQYWELKLKLLKSEQDGSLGKLTNGSV